MAEVDWFPIAQRKVTIRQALASVIPITFTGDDIRKNKVYRSARKRNEWDGQVCTLSGRMNRHGIHPSENRYFSLEEIARLGSYPDGFNFFGTPTHRTIQIGNSVPPLMMRAIIARISELFFGQESKKIKDGKDYLTILNEAWQQHLAPRKDNAPTFISLFAGCGGSSLGYSMAGYRELLAVEWDNNAVETFKLNFSDIPVYHGDIHDLTIEYCLKLAGINAGELDLLDGSPPCQGFSTAGKRQMDDKRNQLYMEYVRLLRGLQPKVFVMENVSGLVKGKMKLIFADIMKELKASEYTVKCKLLNAMYFHVPQSRQRLIWIGVRNDFLQTVQL